MQHGHAGPGGVWQQVAPRRRSGARRALTTHWSRRPTASARASLRLLGAAHRGRSADTGLRLEDIETKCLESL